MKRPNLLNTTMFKCLNDCLAFLLFFWMSLDIEKPFSYQKSQWVAWTTHLLIIWIIYVSGLWGLKQRNENITMGIKLIHVRK